jgi:hypothetical protein
MCLGLGLGPPDALYQLSWIDMETGERRCAAVLIRRDTIIEAPPELRWYLGRPIGRLLYWIGRQDGGWVRFPPQQSA